MPIYSNPEIDITAGKDYDGWLFNTAIDNQMAFNSDQFTDEIQVSVFEIPPAFIGSDIHLGFAAATDYTDMSENHGWGLCKWFIPPEILELIGHVLIGILAGGLFVFAIMYRLGAIDDRGPVFPVRGPARTWTPGGPTLTPTPIRVRKLCPVGPVPKCTPTPVHPDWPTPVPIFEVWTAKKKKKIKSIEDDDRDGVVEASIYLFGYGEQLKGYMIHVCCFCALTHEVDFWVDRTPLLKIPILRMRWETNDRKTHINRIKKFGMGYLRPPNSRAGTGFDNRGYSAEY